MTENSFTAERHSWCTSECRREDMIHLPNKRNEHRYQRIVANYEGNFIEKFMSVYVDLKLDLKRNSSLRLKKPRSYILNSLRLPKDLFRTLDVNLSFNSFKRSNGRLTPVFGGLRLTGPPLISCPRFLLPFHETFSISSTFKCSQL